MTKTQRTRTSRDVLEQIAPRLRDIVEELSLQALQEAPPASHRMSVPDEIELIKEYVEVGGEFELAYDSLVCLLAESAIELSGVSAVKLLEVGLLLGYKSERAEDRQFDRRNGSGLS